MIMLRKILVCSTSILFTFSTEADSATGTDLKTIMQDLRNDAALILDGLLIDDHDAVANAAARIADHPQIPPEQVTEVVAELGSEMAAFKQFDTLVHDLSLAIQSAALENDRSQAVASYQQMVSACLACHASFRERVSTVLNTARDTE